MTHEEVLREIEVLEGRLAELRERRDPAALRRLIRAAKAKAELCERQLELALHHGEVGPGSGLPQPTWAAIAMLTLPLGLVIPWLVWLVL